MAKDKCIADFLIEQGFNTVASERAARETLIAGGLTNSTKRNISCDKLARARETLARTLFRVCTDERCQLLASLEAGARRTVTVTGAGCQVCGGKKAKRSVEWASYQLGSAGISRVLVVGGTRAEHDEILRHACLSGIGQGGATEFRFVDGTKPGRASEAASAYLSWADLVVIWTNTPLKHTISGTYMAGRRQCSKVVFANCTGAAAMLDQIVSGIAHARLMTMA